MKTERLKQNHGDVVRETRLVRVGDLLLDPRFNRAIRSEKVNRLVEEWDPRATQTLVVSLRKDGSMVVIEGQHRREAALLKFGADYRLPCEIQTGMTLEEEAALVVRINKNRSTLSKYDTHKAAIVAKDKEAIELDEMLSERGLRASSSKGVYRVGCIGAIQVLQREYGIAAVGYGLDFLLEIWGVARQPWEGELIQAIVHIFERNEDVDTKRLQRILVGPAARPLFPRDWKGGLMGGSESRGIMLAEKIVNKYNNKLPLNKKITWTKDG